MYEGARRRFKIIDVLRRLFMMLLPFVVLSDHATYKRSGRREKGPCDTEMTIENRKLALISYLWGHVQAGRNLDISSWRP
jgi:hypothetical protein